MTPVRLKPAAPCLESSTLPLSHCTPRGVQWLSGRVLEARQRGCKFEPHWVNCIVSLSKTHLYLLSTGLTKEERYRHNWKIVDWDVKNQINQTNKQLIQ